MIRAGPRLKEIVVRTEEYLGDARAWEALREFALVPKLYDGLWESNVYAIAEQLRDEIFNTLRRRHRGKV